MPRWANGMNLIIDEIFSIVKYGSQKLESIMYPWVNNYTTNKLFSDVVQPFIRRPMRKILNVSIFNFYAFSGLLLQF